MLHCARQIKFHQRLACILSAFRLCMNLLCTGHPPQCLCVFEFVSGLFLVGVSWWGEGGGGGGQVWQGRGQPAEVVSEICFCKRIVFPQTSACRVFPSAIPSWSQQTAPLPVLCGSSPSFLSAPGLFTCAVCTPNQMTTQQIEFKPLQSMVKNC